MRNYANEKGPGGRREGFSRKRGRASAGRAVTQNALKLKELFQKWEKRRSIGEGKFLPNRPKKVSRQGTVLRGGKRRRQCEKKAGACHGHGADFKAVERPTEVFPLTPPDFETKER